MKTFIKQLKLFPILGIIAVVAYWIALTLFIVRYIAPTITNCIIAILSLVTGWIFSYLSYNQNQRKETLLIKKLIRLYFDEEDINYRQYGIIKLECLNTKKKVIVNIYLSAPGIFIGKGANTIDKVKNFLETSLPKKNIQLHLIESDIWN